MKKKKSDGSQNPEPPQKLLSSEHVLPLWARLGQPSSGPLKIKLVSRAKSVNDMTNGEIASDVRELIMILAQRAKQKHDVEAITSLVVAAKTINLFLESIERTHQPLFAFAAEHGEWPVNLPPKQQMVDAVVARLKRLKVGTKSIPSTRRGSQLDSKNWATQIACELRRRLDAWRAYQLSYRSRRRKAEAPSVSKMDVALMKSLLKELGPIPKMCSNLRKLPPLGPETWQIWWPYAEAALDALWNQQSKLYQECIERYSQPHQLRKSEGTRKSYATNHFRQAFASIAKNIGS